MSDIVERLRNVFPFGFEGEMRHEAADEIERLRRIPKHYGAPTDDPEAAIRWITGIMDIENRHLREERDRLREALQEIADDGTTDVLVDEPEGRLWTVRQTEAARIAMRALGEDRT